MKLSTLKIIEQLLHDRIEELTSKHQLNNEKISQTEKADFVFRQEIHKLTEEQKILVQEMIIAKDALNDFSGTSWH